MLNKFTVLTCLLFSLNSFAQKKKADTQIYIATFDIKSFPDSSRVYLKNELVGFTPCIFDKTINFKTDSIYKLEIKKSGYKDFAIQYIKDSKPKQITSLFAQLERVRYKYDSVSTTAIELSKIIFEVEQGQNVGKVKTCSGAIDLKWEESFAVATEEFNKIAEDELIKSGYKIKKQVKLFAEEGIDKEAPLLFGANLKNLQINYEMGTYYIDDVYMHAPVDVECEVELEWQIFSRKKQEVIYTCTTKGKSFVIDRGTNNVSKAIKDAVRDALIELGFNAEMRKTVQNFSNLLPKIKTDTKTVSLPKKTPEKFADYAAMIKRSIESTVTVLRDDEGHGSGFLISDNGYLITNHHVIDKAKEITVKFENGFEFPAELVAFDEDYDVALLKIKGSGFKGLAVNTTMAGVATDVTSISTPADVKLGQTVSKGIISGKRELEGKLYYQTDVSISPGSSGGPLFNSKGEVIGITTWVIRGGGTEGLNFAIPVSVAIEKLGITFIEAPKSNPAAPKSPYKK
jgi:serine protease Do